MHASRRSFLSFVALSAAAVIANACYGPLRRHERREERRERPDDHKKHEESEEREERHERDD